MHGRFATLDSALGFKSCAADIAGRANQERRYCGCKSPLNRTAAKIIDFAVFLTLTRLRVNFDAVSFRRAEDPHRLLGPRGL